MQRRDLLRAALCLAGSAVLQSRHLALASGLPAPGNVSGIVLERDVAVIWPDSGKMAADLWRLQAGQWIVSEAYAAFVHGRRGGLFTLLDAGNHCLVHAALRVHGGCVHYETRRQLAAKQWRYLLYASV